MEQPIAQGVDERQDAIIPYHDHGRGESPARLQAVQRDKHSEGLS